MHAYLIIAHNQFRLLNKLLKALDYKDNDIYIHIDSKAGEINENEIIQGVEFSKIFFVKRQNVIWGHFSQISCELELFSNAVKNKNYQYLHLISGVDFPIKSQQYIHNFFDDNQGKEFIHFEGRELPFEDREKVMCFFPLQKYIGNRKKDTSFLYCVQRAIVNIEKLIKFDRHKKETIRFYKGANWVSITGEFAKFLVEHSDEIRQIYRKSMCCDEIFLQTLFMNSPFKENLYKSNFQNDYTMCMRYIDWNRGGPYVFKKQDFDLLMSSEMLFARKFDYEAEPEIVDMIYEAIKSH